MYFPNEKIINLFGIDFSKLDKTDKIYIYSIILDLFSLNH